MLDVYKKPLKWYSRAGVSGASQIINCTIHLLLKIYIKNKNTLASGLR